MADLRQAFLELGFADVQTYIQSGNVVFRSPRGAARVVADIQAGLERSFAADIKVLLRTHAQLDKVISSNPLTGGSRDASKLHVTFLADKANPTRARSLATDGFLPDEFRVRGQDVYLYCPNGYGRTKLNNAFFERSLDVVATTRNWNTVRTLAGLSAG